MTDRESPDSFSKELSEQHRDTRTEINQQIVDSLRVTSQVQVGFR